MLVIVSGALAACNDGARQGSQSGNGNLRGPSDLDDSVRRSLTALSPDVLPPPPPDVTNRFADDLAAAQLGKKFFFERRFSGALLDDTNNGTPGTLGTVGETGKVACADCHVPQAGFLDARSPRQQLSLGSSWTRRRAPSLLGVAQATFLMWDGRHDAAFGQPLTPLEDPLEMNSSRLFVAQQVARLYRTEYEAIFGPIPSLDEYEPLDPSEVGCTEIPVDQAHGACEKPGHDDPKVLEVVVNVGKAIQAFTRRLECGRSRFDDWMDGDAEALTAEEQAGAILFVGKGACDVCHSGPFFTDQWFHNVGLASADSFFNEALDDPGASEGLRLAKESPFNSTGPYSDGDDGRQQRIPDDLSAFLGAFRTPSLRCVSRRPSLMHTGQYRSIEDVVRFFSRGGAERGTIGVSENYPRDFTPEEREQLSAFLRALDGDGPAPEWVTPPELPAEPSGG